MWINFCANHCWRISRVLAFSAKYNPREILQSFLSAKINPLKISLKLSSAKFLPPEKSGESLKNVCGLQKNRQQ